MSDQCEDDFKNLRVRVAPDIFEGLRAAAKANSNSMQAEVSARLRRSLAEAVGSDHALKDAGVSITVVINKAGE